MIEVKDLTKKFKLYRRPRHWLAEKVFGGKRHREITALEGVTFSAARGECLGVIGANGAGKSTLLRVLAGISPPTSGELRVSGRTTAILELDSGFHPEFTGRENIRVGASILGMSDAEIAAREPEIIAFAGIGDFIDLPVKTYSTGMYLRLGFALATSTAPEVLLVDEALAVGDEWFRGRCVDRILKVREQGATIVIVSHDLTLVRALCDRAIFLSRGRIALSGDPPAAINAYLEAIYQEAADAAETAFVSDRPRRGTGELEIVGVRLLDAAFRPTAVLRSGEAFTIEFGYRAHRDCPSPLFGVNFFRADGILAICTNSEASHFTNQKFFPHDPPGDHPQTIAAGREGVARFTVARNPLLEGDYELSVNVYRGRSGAHVAVDEILGAIKLRVVNADHADRGLLLCPGRWEIK